MFSMTIHTGLYFMSLFKWLLSVEDVRKDCMFWVPFAYFVAFLLPIIIIETKSSIGDIEGQT